MQQQYPGPVAEDIDTALPEGVTSAQVWVVPFNSDEPEFRYVEVVRHEDAQQAYVINEACVRRELAHGDMPWGYAFQGYILPRQQEDLLYLEPPPPGIQGRRDGPSLTKVLIKRLDRAVMGWELERGSAENPFVEIMRLQQLVDDDRGQKHTVRLVEALQNEHFIYIITQFCEGGSLADYCPLGPRPDLISESRGRMVFRQMLDNLQFIHARGICHCDIDPGNFLMTADGRILLNDFAMSFHIPEGGVVCPKGRVGKPPYWPPEIMRQVPFNARQVDLWACVVSLFNLLTGQRPYQWPSPQDIGFRFCVLAGAFGSDAANERVQEVLRDIEFTVREFYPNLGPDERADIIRREQMGLEVLIQRMMAMSPQVRELFHNCLRLQPVERWTVQEIFDCEWMNMDLPHP